MFNKFLPFKAPSRYVWRDPDTERMFEEPTKTLLIKRIMDYRRENNLENIEELSFVLESYWCTLPENEGKCVPIEITKRGFFGYIKGGVAFIKNLMYKSFAHQNVADARSEQCAECKYNVFPEDKAAFESWTNQIAVASTDGRKSKCHERLGECAVCTCPMRAKVFYNEKIEIEPEWEERMKEVQCWQSKERK